MSSTTVNPLPRHHLVATYCDIPSTAGTPQRQQQEGEEGNVSTGKNVPSMSVPLSQSLHPSLLLPPHSNTLLLFLFPSTFTTRLSPPHFPPHPDTR